MEAQLDKFSHTLKFHEMLKKLGYKVETNNHMQVISAILEEFSVDYLFKTINSK